MTTCYTIGHSNRSLHDFVALLTAHEIRHVIDVRKLRGSRRYPHFNADAMAAALADADITMSHSSGLTGRRNVSREVPFEVNAWWQNRSFHNYADHALTPQFHEALSALEKLGTETTTAIMCSEAVWWRCHRRIIADYLLARGRRVLHIMGPGQTVATELSEGVVVREDGKLSYPLRPS